MLAIRATTGMPMKVIFHIGHSTPVTPVLRDRLAWAWPQLVRKGTLLPALAAPAQAWTLRQVLPPPAADRGPPPPDLAAEHALLHADHTTPQDSLQAQIQHLTPATLLLFPAFPASFGEAEEAALAALAQKLNKAEVHLYCALPRPDLHLERLLTKRIEQGGALDDLNREVLSLLDSPHVDYRQLLTVWRGHFPKATLHLSAAAGIETDIAQYFETFGLPVLPPLATECTPMALRRAFLDPVRLANHLFPGDLDFRSNLLAQFDTVVLPYDNQIELFGTNLRRQLYDAFAPVAEELAQHNDGIDVFTELKAMLQPRPTALETLRPPLLRAIPRFSFGRFDPRLLTLRKYLKKTL